ncbi:PREDICTED: increased DNA methylation 1 [Nelumbo nucifera]|uniref:Increased DNA methylation 1 n=1 Tax=Nelumbo nucifera TaxID=4432 RepID=A0A1U8QAF5_NELNU|nr:PREDICTED: increased DNA methylation 1 [Nelumbo nucifera]XP_019055753.1 PREDICTED: increased DNA methylation 1 [Nelumbo nucifera]XP_019055754.1 PREDICTED: increased DNA methylation 1 [Nelumbo nucifera]XP_019055755.1 PREDICTED: increased DNA methylation 1 [Nelumbo nucifera]XP_019055756.1 PREDICTED: increased DNA methylation 1 [Nelumbo nucifera]XP_019055757.1 PREDICTED: increased DNA methylation 1 [Nelumbo nucifera]XP_019055758.1 PREDICTED: increased DNA methylation 1 [Nelumbo nucifera]XP_0
MLFSKEIECLYDDDFEGSIDEHRIFREVFYGNESGSAAKRCLVTGLINFEPENSYCPNTLLCTNSENSVLTSQSSTKDIFVEVSGSVNDDFECMKGNLDGTSKGLSKSGCLLESSTSLNDAAVKAKRMQWSVDQISDVKDKITTQCSDVGRDLIQLDPRKEILSVASHPESCHINQTTICHLVESSSEGIISSCYFLKQHGEMGSEVHADDGDAFNYRASENKCKVSRFLGIAGKKVLESKAISQPLPNESFAPELLVADSCITVEDKSGALLGSNERSEESIILNSDMVNVWQRSNSARDPRPNLRAHIDRLFKASGWSLEKRKMISRSYWASVYISPKGKVIRAFHIAWKSCGESLFADGCGLMQEHYGKQWTNINQFWTDLCNTLKNIVKEMHLMDSTAVLARHWNLLDPFVTVVYIDKKIGVLRGGKEVKADRNSLLIDLDKKPDVAFAMENVDGVREQIAGDLMLAHELGTRVDIHSHNSFPVTTRTVDIVVEEVKEHILKEQYSKGDFLALGQWRHGGEGNTLKGMPIYVTTEKGRFPGANTRSKIRDQLAGTLNDQMSSWNLSSVPVLFSDITGVRPDGMLNNAPTTSGTVNMMDGQAGDLQNSGERSSGRRRGRKKKAIKDALVDLCKENAVICKRKDIDRMENQLERSALDQLGCRNEIPITACNSNGTLAQVDTCLSSTILVSKCVAEGIVCNCSQKGGGDSSCSVLIQQNCEDEDLVLNHSSKGFSRKLCCDGEVGKGNLKNKARVIESESEVKVNNVSLNSSVDLRKNSSTFLSGVNLATGGSIHSIPEGSNANNSLVQHTVIDQADESMPFALDVEVNGIDVLKNSVMERTQEGMLSSRHNGDFVTGLELCKQSAVEQQKMLLYPQEKICHGMIENPKEDLSQRGMPEIIREVTMRRETRSSSRKRSVCREGLSSDMDIKKDSFDFSLGQGELVSSFKKEKSHRAAESSTPENDHESVATEIRSTKMTYKMSKNISEIKTTKLNRKSKKLCLSSLQKVRTRSYQRNRTHMHLKEHQKCCKANARNDSSRRRSSPASSLRHQGAKGSKFKRFHHQCNGSDELHVVTPSRKRRRKLHFENGIDEIPLQVNSISLASQNCKKIGRSRKSVVHSENGPKRLHRCQIEDDDLLIAAIIKNQDFSPSTKGSTVKMVWNSKSSKSVRKLKSQRGSCKLLPRSPGKGGKHYKDGKWSSSGPRSVLSWLLDSGVVFVNDVIQYRSPKDNLVVKDGWISRDGILCKCCRKVFSVSEFKVHAGFKLYRPCMNLFMESGKSFTLCQLEAWSSEYKSRKGGRQAMQVDEMDQNDDTCGRCGDGGELICCDNCPSTFHHSCLSAQELPEGSWYCPNCTCWICGYVVNAQEASDSFLVLKCSQCEHKYHEACIHEKGMHKGMVFETWFCGGDCQEVYSGLRSRVGAPNRIEDGFSWTLLRCIHGDPKVLSAQKFALMAECNSKLAVALTIMEECFLSMVDPRTGIDMIPHVLYNWGSNFARLNYEGFYAVVLEKDDELISVASIRVHGVTVAEMPLIATSSERRRQGMCRRLISAIEEMLKSFKVEKLVVAAIPNLLDTWTLGFGFKPMEDKEKEQLNNINLMMFPGTTLLQKRLYEKEVTESRCAGMPFALACKE